MDPWGFPAAYSKERRSRRFPLHLPVRLSFPWAGLLHDLKAVSENVSTGGVLLKASDRIPPHTPVSLRMDVNGPWLIRTVQLLGEGEVVRVEELASEQGFEIAVECKQPITEMEEPFSC